MGNHQVNSKKNKTDDQKINEETVATSASMNILSKSNKKDLKELAAEKYKIVFKWNEGGKSVCISGSFCKWKQMIALEKSSDGSSFEIRLSLPIGIYQYKYFVDDKWLFSNEDPICTDDDGNINNIIDINLIALKSKYSTNLKLFNYFELKSTGHLPLEYLSHNLITFVYNDFISNTLRNYQQQRLPLMFNGSVHHFSLIERYQSSEEKVEVAKLGVSCRYRQKLSLFVYYKPIKDNSSIS